MKDRTIFSHDNLFVLRGLDTASVDLIYLDPPFNSNRNYAAPIGSQAAGTAFKDTWSLSDVDNAWHGEIADREPALYQAIHTAELTHGKSMKSYLIMMAVRLLEMKRVLKKTGSVYLHCDDTAVHYLKVVMDAVFGSRNFRNDLAWRRAVSHNDARRFGRNLDNLLFYANGSKSIWNPTAVASPKDATQLADAYRSSDERGRFRSENLTGAGVSGGESGIPWRDFDPSIYGRHWAAPLTGRYAEWIEANIIPNYRSIKRVHRRLDALYNAGMILLPNTKRKWPGLKRYASADQGNSAQALILKPIGFTNYNKSAEYVGYPTQKPLELLELVIKASSNEGDVVLDPFCGCATTCVAAERLGRQWIGIDISEKAVALVRMRLENEVGLFGPVIHRTDIPKRSEELPNYRTHKHTLYGKQEGNCNGCDTHFPFRNLTVDHVIPKSHGGTDHGENLQLLCGACNSTKGQGTQAELMARLKTQGILK